MKAVSERCYRLENSIVSECTISVILLLKNAKFSKTKKIHNQLFLGCGQPHKPLCLSCLVVLIWLNWISNCLKLWATSGQSIIQISCHHKKFLCSLLCDWKSFQSCYFQWMVTLLITWQISILYNNVKWHFWIKEVQIVVYRSFLVNCYLLHGLLNYAWPASNVRVLVIHWTGLTVHSDD